MMGSLTHKGSLFTTSTTRPTRLARCRVQASAKTLAAPTSTSISHSTTFSKATLKSLRKSVKSVRKQAERRFKCPTTPGCVIESSEAEAGAVRQLLQELRQLELGQSQSERASCDKGRLSSSSMRTHRRVPTSPAPISPFSPPNILPPLPQSPATQQPQPSFFPSSSSFTIPIPPIEHEDVIDLTSPEFAPRDYSGVQGRVLVCQGSKCRAKGATGVLQAVSSVVGTSLEVAVLPCKCLGKCKAGAVIRVKQDGVPQSAVYTQLSLKEVPGLLDKHFIPSLPSSPLLPLDRIGEGWQDAA